MILYNYNSTTSTRPNRKMFKKKKKAVFVCDCYWPSSRPSAPESCKEKYKQSVVTFNPKPPAVPMIQSTIKGHFPCKAALSSSILRSGLMHSWHNLSGWSVSLPVAVIKTIATWQFLSCNASLVDISASIFFLCAPVSARALSLWHRPRCQVCVGTLAIVDCCNSHNTRLQTERKTKPGSI